MILAGCVVLGATGEVIEGSLRDKIIGKVSEDGRRWETSWLNYSEVEGSDVPMEDSEILMAESMTFIKIDGD